MSIEYCWHILLIVSWAMNIWSWNKGVVWIKWDLATSQGRHVQQWHEISLYGHIVQVLFWLGGGASSISLSMMPDAICFSLLNCGLLISLNAILGIKASILATIHPDFNYIRPHYSFNWLLPIRHDKIILKAFAMPVFTSLLTCHALN